MPIKSPPQLASCLHHHFVLLCTCFSQPNSTPPAIRNEGAVFPEGRKKGTSDVFQWGKVYCRFNQKSWLWLQGMSASQMEEPRCYTAKPKFSVASQFVPAWKFSVTSCMIVLCERGRVVTVWLCIVSVGGWWWPDCALWVWEGGNCMIVHVIVYLESKQLLLQLNASVIIRARVIKSEQTLCQSSGIKSEQTLCQSSEQEWSRVNKHYVSHQSKSDQEWTNY